MVAPTTSSVIEYHDLADTAGGSVFVRDRAADGSRKLIDLTTVVSPQSRKNAVEHANVEIPPASRRSHECGYSWIWSSRAVYYDHPFPLLKIENALNPQLAHELVKRLKQISRWNKTRAPFYDVDEIELTALLPPKGAGALFSTNALQALRDQLGAIFGCAFLEKVQVVAHRMRPGHGAGIHTDDPNGVEETHRMIITLGAPEDECIGGMFSVFESDSPDSFVRAFPVLHNQCLIFEASTESHHAVTEVEQGNRFSVILSFWREQ